MNYYTIKLRVSFLATFMLLSLICNNTFAAEKDKKIAPQQKIQPPRVQPPRMPAQRVQQPPRGPTQRAQPPRIPGERVQPPRVPAQVQQKIQRPIVQPPVSTPKLQSQPASDKSPNPKISVPNKRSDYKMRQKNRPSNSQRPLGIVPPGNQGQTTPLSPNATKATVPSQFNKRLNQPNSSNLRQYPRYRNNFYKRGARFAAPRLQWYKKRYGHNQRYFHRNRIVIYTPIIAQNIRIPNQFLRSTSFELNLLHGCVAANNGDLNYFDDYDDFSYDDTTYELSIENYENTLPEDAKAYIRTCIAEARKQSTDELSYERAPIWCCLQEIDPAE